MSDPKVDEDASNTHLGDNAIAVLFKDRSNRTLEVVCRLPRQPQLRADLL